MAGWIDAAIQIGVPALLVVLAYFTGSAVERRHYRSIRLRERRGRSFPLLTFREVPPGLVVTDSTLVTGSVVISLDHFKRFVARLRNLVGGRVAAYETLLDRGRREAVLRLQEAAFESGHRAVINLRIEVFPVSGSEEGPGAGGIEVLAYGTALRLARDAA